LRKFGTLEISGKAADDVMLKASFQGHGGLVARQLVTLADVRPLRPRSSFKPKPSL
jgi:hypothetical protein